MATDEGPTAGIDPGPSYSMPEPKRRDTMSTISSEGHPSLPAGLWTLTLHGNCPRCHHHHRSVVTPVKVSNDPMEAHSVHCEHCKQKWLTIGGLNTTQISLLSTRTTDLDREELDFRYMLFSTVRSATAIASPTALASVPEGSSRLPSRGNSQRSAAHKATTDVKPHNRVAKQESKEQITHSTESKANTNIAQPHRKSVKYKVESSRAILRGFKRKLRNAFPAFKDTHIRDLFRFPGQSRVTEKAAGKRPVAYSGDLDSTISKQSFGNVAKAQEDPQQRTQPKDTEDSFASSKGRHQAISDLNGFDREVIKNMTPQERRAWIRDQITDFKCRYNGRCSCRHSASSLMVDSSTQVYLMPVASPGTPRRHSFNGLGDQFSSDMFFPHTGSLAISVARTSEADTAVETQTIASSPQNSGLDIIQRPRHRSLSPRPTSLANSRQSRQFAHELIGRESMNSIVTNEFTRSRNGRRGTERRSIGSLTHMTFRSSRTNDGNIDSIRSSQDLDIMMEDPRTQDSEATLPGSPRSTT
ncbi:hypothetical protein CC80DRAFT_552545 [Byssothecium circinans]|uniref:Uncharacterized protein n=1 Tax=Byssothecium circinans TaxID=147558 RepID=A0A6A5TK99_9PLEO|nr:hypothetical protein CC80DRAFT_552545 [Byssothecium circinans]